MKKRNKIILGTLGGVAVISAIVAISACTIVKNKQEQRKKYQTKFDKYIEELTLELQQNFSTEKEKAVARDILQEIQQIKNTDFYHKLTDDGDVQNLILHAQQIIETKIFEHHNDIDDPEIDTWTHLKTEKPKKHGSKDEIEKSKLILEKGLLEKVRAIFDKANNQEFAKFIQKYKKKPVVSRGNKSIDFKHFNHLIKKVKSLHQTKQYQNYVNELQKEKFEEFKLPYWKRYNQINDFYTRLIAAKPNDPLLEVDKDQILARLKEIKGRLINAPLKNYDHVKLADKELELFYIARIEPLVFREDYLILLNHIKENFKEINVSAIEEEVNKGLQQNITREVFHKGYQALKVSLFLNKNFNIDNLIPEPKHYEMGELISKNEVYARIYVTLLTNEKNIASFEKYGYSARIRDKIGKLIQSDKNYINYFKGILFLEQQIALINERIKAGQEMYVYYKEVVDGWGFTYDVEDRRKVENIKDKISFTSSTEEVRKATEEIKEIIASKKVNHRR
ncbi:hypothetical protein MCAL160_0579 [Mycoplasmopsis californica HAZ160_1]|uniref:Lipoprotein n=1 Tax=Mycoplasmopsis californica HAZ160_1 TaxID=1397850 RepID=A0AAT9F883_9BACT|nr:hypothetical protein [Mycoplasmopsis californica]BAP01097.1 hypothetical protein MCAL160_0579 [Mycoplasmopsis californica HAZ160_1]BBG40963.1 hypothetical protein MCAL106_0579 [Mycoplasmopsis californica]BBG41557.1 hypothetical protein MCAL106E_0579 [Mycoplasmopsis californica]BBG42150.1 hypothetical protein MCAL106L_0579 [Mycoplasmopsis californica]BBG42732.1 hypothetical protein MCAL160E_0579 [Mycoplasmopsis californica]